MKRFICGTLAIAMLCCLLASCGKKEGAKPNAQSQSGNTVAGEYLDPPQMGFLVAEQFTGYNLGNLSELVSESTITERIDSPVLINYTSVDTALSDLKNKKLHGVVLPAVYANEELKKNDTDLKKLELTFIDKQLRAICLINSNLAVPVDAAFTTMQSDGTSEKIAKQYTPYADKKSPYTRPKNYKKVNGRTIKVGISNKNAYPFNFRDDSGKLTGINVDTAYEMAKGAYAELEIKEYAEDKLMDALTSGEVDFILSQYSLAEDEKIPGNLAYSHPYSDASTYIIIRSPLADPPAGK